LEFAVSCGARHLPVLYSSVVVDTHTQYPTQRTKPKLAENNHIAATKIKLNTRSKKQNNIKRIILILSTKIQLILRKLLDLTRPWLHGTNTVL
jgi:hypothetical protein